jgi:hypothetical protein
VSRRVRALIAVTALVLMAAACGPEGPTEAGGTDADPLAVLTILPSPGDLRGSPAAPADEARLQRALTGARDAELADALRGRALKDAAVRRWTGPGGRELITAISVWDSHLVATGIGGQAAELLLDAPGARAWTPSGLGGARGARAGDGGDAERRLAHAVGPNSIYVRSVGPVDEEIVTRAAERLIRFVQANDG